jgi:hypothetical protein
MKKSSSLTSDAHKFSNNFWYLLKQKSIKLRKPEKSQILGRYLLITQNSLKRELTIMASTLLSKNKKF